MNYWQNELKKALQRIDDKPKEAWQNPFLTNGVFFESNRLFNIRRYSRATKKYFDPIVYNVTATESEYWLNKLKSYVVKDEYHNEIDIMEYKKESV